MADNDTTISHAVRDIALANWFGGSLMGAVGLNGATAAVSDPTKRNRVSAAGWRRWSPLEAASMLAVVASDTVLLANRKKHLVAQHGYGRNVAIKLAINGAAAAATAATWVLGRKTGEAGDVPVRGATEPDPETPQATAQAQRGLKFLQWAVPALTGAHIVVNGLLDEQERVQSVTAGVARRGVRAVTGGATIAAALAAGGLAAVAIASLQRRQGQPSMERRSPEPHAAT